MRRKTHKRKRTHKALSDHHRSPRRRRSHKRGLFDLNVSKGALLDNAKQIGWGLAGGALANLGQKLLVQTKLGTIGKLIAGAGVGFLGASFGFRELGVGFVGGITAQNFDLTSLKDGIEEDAELKDLPVYQTEQGEFVKMLNDGTLEPLSDEELADINKIYPEYSTMNPMQM